MKHKSLLVYVPCLEGGCKDIGRVELDGHTLVSDERLWDLEAAEKEREIDEERIADLMADLNRVGHENDALRAKIERMDTALGSLLIRCDDSDSVMYGTLSTSFVRDTVRIARGALEESK